MVDCSKNCKKRIAKETRNLKVDDGPVQIWGTGKQKKYAILITKDNFREILRVII